MTDIDRTGLGRIAVDEAALTRLVRDEVGRVEGVHAVRARSTRISVDERRVVAVSVGVVADPGLVLPELGGRVQARVAELARTTLEPTELQVNVTVEGIAR